MACSRTPKWKFRPPGVERANAGSSPIQVLFDGARSAEPPVSSGMTSGAGPAVGELAGEATLEFRGEIRIGAAPARDQISPLLLRHSAVLGDVGEGLAGLVGNVERRILRPAEPLLRQVDLLVTER
jgi:hypothetical protein